MQLSLRSNGFLLCVLDWIRAVQNRADRAEREKDTSWELSCDYEGQDGPQDKVYKLMSHKSQWCELIESEALGNSDPLV